MAIKPRHLILFLPSFLAHAAETPAVLPPPAESAPSLQQNLAAKKTFYSKPIDLLEQDLLLNKNRRLPVFRKIQAALAAKDPGTALSALKSLAGNMEFADYYHYLSGQAEFERMKKAISINKAANARLAGEQAVFHYTQLVGSNPFTALSRRAQAGLGETEITLAELHLSSKKRAQAMLHFEKGFQHSSQVNLLAAIPKQSIVHYALSCEQKPADVCVSWVAKLSPALARTEEARIVEKLTAFKRPSPVEKTTSIPYRVDLDLQAFQKAFGLYLEGKYDDAFMAWSKLLNDYPRTSIKLRTKFWMGRAAQKSKHDLQAETLYRQIIRELPFSYYALLASWFANIDLARMMDAELPAAMPETPLLSPADLTHVRRAETLIASGAPELASIELQDVHPTTSMPNEFLVYMTALQSLAGCHQAAFQVFGELSSRNFQGLFSSYGEKLLFPTTHLPLIRLLVKDAKVDPLVVISIIKQESAFNVDAISQANAFGLMQIIAPTARDLSPRSEIMDLFDPAHNIKLGAKYIGQLLTRYKGNIVLALAAYNAGPGHADRWNRENTALLAQQEEFIEQITFKETREYVQNILRNYYWYSRRIRGDSYTNLSALIQAAALQAKRSTSSSLSNLTSRAFFERRTKR